ncbi:hypothetical protein [Breoghania sp.]|uniref:hypothetical protein n=1 Tax=Breoghania sp. TaxID=2065378 RepID=UPI00260C8344|nr:hypothetical protein [Breoghania sp.]MDJ0933480.1 hypothetical protein [Breoghania sp.]
MRWAVEMIAEASAKSTGSTPDDAAAIRYLSRLVGALTLARTAHDSELSEQILEANRELE